MRVLICGGRDYSWTDAVNWLDQNLRDEIAFATGYHSFSIELVIHGGARGADEGAARYATGEGIPARCFPADWKKHGKAAGPIRNRKMLEEGKPDIVVALPGGRGTANMIALAEASGVPVIRAAA